MTEDGDVTNLFLTRPAFAKQGTAGGSGGNAYNICVLDVMAAKSPAQNP